MYQTGQLKIWSHVEKPTRPLSVLKVTAVALVTPRWTPSSTLLYIIYEKSLTRFEMLAVALILCCNTKMNPYDVL